MKTRQASYTDKDPRVKVGLEWNAPTVPIREKEVESPGLIDGFLKRVDEEIAKKQVSIDALRISRVADELHDCSFTPVISPKTKRYSESASAFSQRRQLPKPSARADPTGERLVSESKYLFLSSLRSVPPPTQPAPFVPTKPVKVSARLLGKDKRLLGSVPPASASDQPPIISESLRTAFSSLVNAKYQVTRPGAYHRHRRPFPSPAMADLSVRTIQHWWRKVIYRVRLRKVIRKFIKIQAMWRGGRVRHQVRREKLAHLAAVAIQTAFLRWKLRRTFAAIMIQRWYRFVQTERQTIEHALTYFTRRVEIEQEKLRAPVHKIQRREIIKKPINLEIVKERSKWKGTVNLGKKSPREAKRSYPGTRPLMRLMDSKHAVTTTIA